MKGILYQLQVSLSTMDYVHSSWTPMKEIFIPKIGICFNEKGFAFETDKDRYKKHKKDKKFPMQPNPEKIKDIQVTSEDVAVLLSIVHQRKTINRMSKQFFDKKVYEDD